MRKWINKSKTHGKHFSCERRCEFNGKKFNSKQKQKSQCECKKQIKRRAPEENYVWNPGTYACEC